MNHKPIHKASPTTPSLSANPQQEADLNYHEWPQFRWGRLGLSLIVSLAILGMGLYLLR